MFVLQRADLLALVGLLVQTFAAWIFVAVLRALRRREASAERFTVWEGAFLALACALTVLSVRFFQGHERPAPEWNDGQWLPIATYVGYQLGKGLFGVLAVQGCCALAGLPPPPWLRRVRWPLVIALAASPLAFATITNLVILQSPVMVLASWASLRALRGVPAAGSGMRFVRAAMIAHGVTWTVHLLAAAIGDLWWPTYYLRAFNSFIDLGVLLTLGTGLIVALLQEADRRMRDAERERARLQQQIAREDRLRALGTLVSGVAHELNNPLTAILGYADDLGDPAMGRHAASIVREQAERCRGIVRSLSALAGHASHPRQAVCAVEIVHRVVRGLGKQLAASEREVRVHAPARAPLYADRVGVEQVLTNLLVNAIDASHRGGAIDVHVECAANAVEIAVEDDGPGLPPEVRERLFEPFFTTKDPGRGTGLGLAVAHAIVRAHGGTITADSGVAGRGARFVVALPRNSAPVRLPVAAAPDAPAQLRLLVVDDEPSVRTVVRRHAERQGWSVREAPSAEQAIEDLRRGDGVDAVLCDLRMEGLGGIGLHDHLAAEHPELLRRTVFCTGDLASAEAAAFSRRCRQPLIEKPFDFRHLLGALERTARRGASAG
jgi:two-component system NtrC family sensor kinase